jgi:EAL domain-containing protein (putative c-di-GMP-specific phosphodiesterase class I)/integral membrane sensor domain MASE1
LLAETPRPERPALSLFARTLVVAGLAFAACWLMQGLAFNAVQYFLLWPASAVALAFGWRYGLVWTLPAAVGAAAWGFLSFGRYEIALAAALVCVTGPALAVGVLQRLNAWKPADFRLEAVLRFLVVVGLLATPLDAIFASSALSVTGLVDRAGSAHAFVAWWLLDALGMLMLTPVILASIKTQSETPEPASEVRWVDPSSLLMAVVLSLAIVLIGDAGQTTYARALLYFYFPLVSWTSVRMTERVTAWTVLATATPLLTASAYVARSAPDNFIRTMDAAVIVLCAVMVGLILQAVATDRRIALIRVARQSRQDMSTGLLNDRGLLAEFSDRLAAPTRTHYGLIGVHFSNFDALSDLCGPMPALQLEQTAAALILRQPGAQIGARLSSGRYILLIQADTVAQVRTICRELYSQLNGQVFRIEHGSLRLQACVAGLFIDKHVLINSEDCMMSLSDAMAIAASVRDPQLFVEPLSQTTIDARRSHQSKMEHIREAIREERFEVHAQTIVDPDARDGSISYEVLTRLRDRDGVMIRPPEFLPLAMQAQMTVALDRGVVRSVFSFLALNPEALARTHKCSINLSGMTMSDGTFAGYVREQRTIFGIPSDKIVFEITESEAIRNPAAASRLVEDLKSDGFGIALDDFGTGLATFEYLKRFPLDYLKIDGSFIRNLMNNPIDEEIVLSTIRVARRLNVKTVAEHVHNQEIYDRLLSLGVEYLQGELVSSAIPIADMFEKLPSLASLRELAKAEAL